jgi:cellulose biosynthesis protein BcsQ
MELAYILANVAGRKVLLVDADMGRGYIAPALGSQTSAFARERNLYNLANYYFRTNTMPSLSEFTYPYPAAYGGSNGNLDILFGIMLPKQASDRSFTKDNGASGERFVEALTKRAWTNYEFVIFDIGTLLPTPIHANAIKYASSLVVVTSPMLPSVAPTKKGLEQMQEMALLGERKPVLVINKWTNDCGIAKDEFPEFLRMTLFATIPSIDLSLLQKIVNKGQFYTEYYLKSKGNEPEALKPMVTQLLNLAEQYSPGTRSIAERNIPKLAAAVKERRHGLFGKR